MKKILLTILVLILIAGGVAGGYWYGTASTKQKVTPQKTEQAAQTANDGIYLKDMHITNLGLDSKTYKNDRYGFEFSYPDIFNLDVDVDFESASSITLTNPRGSVGSVSVGVVYNPMLIDPLTKAKQDLDACTSGREQNGGLGVPCGIITGSLDQWKTIKIDDRYTGYRTGIQSGTILTDTYYLFDSQYKGRILRLTANINNIPSRKDDQSDPLLAANKDPDVKSFILIFDGIINSAKVNWLGN